MTPKETTLRALRNLKGDDLERAKAAFRNYSDKELDMEYGQSGQTCREILEGYQRHRDEVESAITWVNSL